MSFKKIKLTNGPFFSIILPTYNRADFIEKAVHSVINQTYEGWELIVVDDGSEDNTKELISGLNNSKILYFWQENQGRSIARNNGIAKARGKYICFIDSDDYYEVDFLEKLYQGLQVKGFPVAFFFSNVILEKGTTRQIIDYPEIQGNPLEYFLLNSVGTIQGCLHYRILKEFKFDPDLSIGEDLALWIQVADKYPVHYFPTHAVVAGVHENRSINRRSFNSGANDLATLKKIFSVNRQQKNKISRSIKNWRLSNSLSSIGFFYLLNGKRTKSIWFLLRAIFLKPSHAQTKFRIYAVFCQIPFFGFFFKKSNVELSLPD